MVTTLAQGDIWRRVIQAEKKTGERCWEKISCFPVFVSGLSSSHIIAFKEDVTLQKEAEIELIRNSEEISDLYENAPCGYHTLDNEGVFIKINATELSWLGYQKEEIVGMMKIVDLLAGESASALHAISQRLIEGGIIENLELEFRRKNGTSIPILLNSTAVLDDEGEVIASRAIIIDNHERKEMIGALRAAKTAADLSYNFV